MRLLYLTIALLMLTITVPLATAGSDEDARAALAISLATQKVSEDIKPHLPPAGNCKCGCAQTGRCDCKDCDHPRLEPKKAKACCSGACTCGCNAGETCICGVSSTTAKSTNHCICSRCPDGRVTVNWDGTFCACGCNMRVVQDARSASVQQPVRLVPQQTFQSVPACRSGN